MATLVFNAHWSDFSSGTLLLSSGLRFRSNDHSLKHAYSLRPCSSSTARGPYMLGAREAPGDPRIPRIPPWLRLWVSKSIGMNQVSSCSLQKRHFQSTSKVKNGDFS